MWRCFAGIVDLWDLTESDVDDRYRGHEWYRDQRLDSEDRYDHPASTTGISFAGSHSRRWGEAVEADSDDEFVDGFGYSPMAIATGAGAESRVAMGIAVVGGMVCATFLSLFVIPAIYSYLSTEKVNVIGEEHKE